VLRSHDLFGVVFSSFLWNLESYPRFRATHPELRSAQSNGKRHSTGSCLSGVAVDFEESVPAGFTEPLRSNSELKNAENSRRKVIDLEAM